MPHSLTWQIGNVKVTRVVEIELPGLQFILPDATPENCSQINWLFPHFVTPEGDPIAAVQTFIVESQGARIMVDTCIGNDKTLAIKPWCNRQGPFLQDLGAHPRADGDLKVGRGELEPALVGGEQHVLGNGQRGARRNRALDDPEAVTEILL